MPTLAPRFTQRFLDELPGDPLQDPRPRQVHGALWSRVQPTAVAAPRLLAWSRPLASELGLPATLMQEPATAAVLGGNALWPGMAPYAANYGGHQFGHWAGQLGDGRAIVLGELLRHDGARFELQLKGAGPTPYSRMGDGRAVLRSSLREFLCSEAMHHLGVPTTRALSLVATGDDVVRDMFYDGRAMPEPGAIVCRVAPSFLRFGNFELPGSRGDLPLLRQLATATLRWLFPQFLPASGEPGPEAFAAFYREVAARTARLIARWQALGFVHGVMNTDNLSILGLTIDYGPYGWLDNFDPDWTPNTTDAHQRRYCYGNQPGIGLWNIERLGIALLPLFGDDERVVHDTLAHYRETYAAAASEQFAAKLGLQFRPEHGDGPLLQELFTWLGAAETDWTLFFRNLSAVAKMSELPDTVPEALAACSYAPLSPERATGLRDWLRRWWQRTRLEAVPGAQLAERMDATNPWLVLRNWVAQEAIDAASGGDLQPLQDLLVAVERPFVEQPAVARWAQKRPEWARHRAGCSALSCSS